jgi:sialic acid synthase SpsE/mannose-6-phosphate isomerase-like protein (cupin superfamily)
MNYFTKPLFTFEMANNHMGDVNHGLLIVREFGKFIQIFPEFNFSMKLQYRSNSFIHEDHKFRQDHKLIKRFTETKLSDDDFKIIIDEIHKHKFISMCTPWDQSAVNSIIKMGIQVIKVASCSFTDWDLLEKIVEFDHPIIASTAGAEEDDIKNVYTFLNNRKKLFAFLHCVGEYPCVDENLEMNQIDYLLSNFKIPIGYSTHENPDNVDSIKIAISKGARIFEKHIGVENEKYKLNAYSANSKQISNWLESAKKTFLMLGKSSSLRKSFSVKELDDLRILYRGAYALEDIKKGEVINKKIFLAMPNINGQLVAKDLGKYKIYKAKKNIEINKPLMFEDLYIDDTRSQIKIIYEDVKKIINDSPLVLKKNSYLEISHFYGIENFMKYGATMVRMINREYCKFAIIMLPGQEYPQHYHNKKNESYYILSGSLIVRAGSIQKNLRPGESFSVEHGTLHSFVSDSGCVFEEISTANEPGDTIYSDDKISKNLNRKTHILF